MTNTPQAIADPTGKPVEKPVDFPLPSLRDFMLPDQLVLIQSFEAETLQALDTEVNRWVQQTKSIIAIPSTITQAEGKYLLTLTYVPAATGNENGQN